MTENDIPPPTEADYEIDIADEYTAWADPGQQWPGIIRLLAAARRDLAEAVELLKTYTGPMHTDHAQSQRTAAFLKRMEKPC